MSTLPQKGTIPRSAGFVWRKRCTKCRDWKDMAGGAGYKTGWVCKDCKPRKA